MKKITYILIAILSINCGGGGGGDNSTEVDLSLNTRMVVEQTFGTEGNLWKPKSDGHSSGAGNLVVLFSSKFTSEFNSCEVRLNDGSTSQLICINNQSWTHVPFSCFSNGGRQTWRANFTCGKASGVEVLCKTDELDYVFTVPPAARAAVCSRFG